MNFDRRGCIALPYLGLRSGSRSCRMHVRAAAVEIVWVVGDPRLDINPCTDACTKRARLTGGPGYFIGCSGAGKSNT